MACQVPANPSPMVTVLVVDDEPTIRRLVGRIMATGGHPVLEAADAAEAIALFRLHADRIGLVISDVNLPRVTGPQLVGRLVTIVPTLPVVYMSADIAQLTRGTPPPGGRVSLVAKPFTLHTLLAAVAVALSSPQPGSA